MFSWLVFLLGIGLLLYGLRVMQGGLEQAAKHKISAILLRLAGNPFSATITGVIATCLVPSSTAVTVLAIGFVNSGIMTLAQAVGIVLGSNVGTCLTVQLMALDLGRAAPLLLTAGIILRLAGRRRGPAPLGLALAGFGAIFLSLDLMAHALGPLGESPWFYEMVAALEGNYLAAAAAGALVTGLVHSSSASTGVVITMAREGLIGLPEAVALVLGNNVGTCFTALLASLAGSQAGKRVAVAHLLINVAGAAVVLPLVPALAAVLPLLGASTSHQVAAAHTIFNVVSTLVILPFIHPFVRMLYLLIPRK